MKTYAEFMIQGYVGRVQRVGATLRVSIAAEYGRRDERGDFQANPYWNEVTLFTDRTIEWAEKTLGPGDLVMARGTVRQTNYDKGGQTVYAVTLAAESLDLIVKKDTSETERAA